MPLLEMCVCGVNLCVVCVHVRCVFVYGSEWGLWREWRAAGIGATARWVEIKRQQACWLAGRRAEVQAEALTLALQLLQGRPRGCGRLLQAAAVLLQPARQEYGRRGDVCVCMQADAEV